MYLKMKTTGMNSLKTRFFHRDCLFRLLISTLYCWLTIANVSAAENCAISGSGIGGTGVTAKESGVGGTGAIANEGGIGGTGVTAEGQTGVITGTITGFGSICVNGIEIHYRTTTPVVDIGNTDIPDDLAIGNLVNAKVTGLDSEVTASEIRRMYAVQGPVSDIDLSGQRIRILGQRVSVNSNTHFAGFHNERELEAQIQTDDYLVVSGLRRSGGEIIASRIEKIHARLTTSVMGPVTEITAEGFRIYGINIDTNRSITLVTGQQVYVSGRFDGDTLTAERVIETSNIQIPSVGEIVIMEGYIHDLSGVSQLDIGGRTIELPAQLHKEIVELELDQRVIVQGLVSSDNVIRADYILIEMEVDDFGDSVLEKIEKQEDAKKPVVERNSERTNAFAKKFKDSKESLSPTDHVEIQNSGQTKIYGSGSVPEVRQVDSDRGVLDSPVESVPTVNIPQAEVFDNKPPEIDPSELDIPAVEFREVEIPEVEVPAIPQIEVPIIDVPIIDVPVIDVPQVDVPEIRVPEVNVPEVEISR